MDTPSARGGHAPPSGPRTDGAAPEDPSSVSEEAAALEKEDPASSDDADTTDPGTARENGKRINEEAFANDTGPDSWVDRHTDDTDRRSSQGAASRRNRPNGSAPQQSFFTDRTHTPAADRIEEAVQDFVYRVNNGAADTDWTPTQVRDRRIATMFAVLVSKVAEDMSYERTAGDAFWDARQIMRRQIDRRPLRHCKKAYAKRRLALLVDTSPSCRDEAVFYSKIASGAMLRDDIDLFLCPNGRIDARLDPESMRFVTDDRGADWDLDSRTVLYFTDWDGADEIVEHARTCTLYWFDNCPPDDYWASTSERRQQVRLQFKGRHFHCPDADAFRRLARKIRP
jgi:hypothetical protein